MKYAVHVWIVILIFSLVSKINILCHLLFAVGNFEDVRLQLYTFSVSCGHYFVFSGG